MMFIQCLMSSVYILIVLVFKVFYFLAQFIIGSYVQFEAKYLKGNFALALSEAQRYSKEFACALIAQQAAFVKVQCLQWVCEKVYLKEFRLVKQGFYKLESEEKDFNLGEKEIILYSPAMGFLIALKSPLANLFFNPFFLLPNLISSNIP